MNSEHGQMDSKVLVAYATKHGATAEIAARIGEVLSEAGLAVKVLPVNRIAEPDSYAAVIVGSAVYMGQWLKEAADFLKANETKLAGKPVWFFSSGPTGEGDPVEIMKGWRFPDSLQPAANSVKPRDIALFHGVIDMKKLSFLEKLAVKAVKAPAGDFREWENICAWAEKIAAELKK